jgi:hypothetical protein
MMTPIVGDVNADGLPEVVFVSFVDITDLGNGEDGILRVISGRDCDELFSVADVGVRTCVDGVSMDLNQRGDAGFLSPGAGVAVGDIDGNGISDIVGAQEGSTRDRFTRLVAFEYDPAMDQLSFKWCSEPASETWSGGKIALADLDGDGLSEIVVGTKVFNADGTLRWDAPAALTEGRCTTVADLDLDGSPEVVTGIRALDAAGAGLWHSIVSAPAYPAVADLEGDGLPEVVVSSPWRESIYVLSGRTGAMRCSTRLPGFSCCGGAAGRGSPATLGDVDGDGILEIGIGTQCYFVLYDFAPGPSGSCSLAERWKTPVVDCSSGEAGSTMFDLQGDGRIEILHQDEQHLWIFDARSGAVIRSIPNSSGTGIEHPCVADVDGDCEAEIIACANNYFLPGGEEGVRVFRDAAETWVPARPIWNQYTYHITNVGDDGSIPATEANNWETYNNFRVQAGDPGACQGSCAPRTQGFWKRQCRGPHPSGEPDRLPDYVDCVNDTMTFAGVGDVSGICEALRPLPRHDKYAQAEAQFMALVLNVCSGRLHRGCCISTRLSPATSVGEAMAEIDTLLSNPNRTRADGVQAQALADAINSGTALCSAPATPLGSAPGSRGLAGCGSVAGAPPSSEDRVGMWLPLLLLVLGLLLARGRQSHGGTAGWSL